MRDRLRSGAADQGQVTILLIGVIVVFLVVVVGLGRYGEAVVHRVQARTAADSIALATASDPGAAAELERWYASQQMLIEHDGDKTVVRSGPSAAAAWATTEVRPPTSAPALTAIIARAEQLRGAPLRSPKWGDLWIEVAGNDAQILLPIAAELGLCEVATDPRQRGWSRLELC